MVLLLFFHLHIQLLPVLSISWKLTKQPQKEPDTAIILGLKQRKSIPGWKFRPVKIDGLVTGIGHLPPLSEEVPRMKDKRSSKPVLDRPSTTKVDGLQSIQPRCKAQVVAINSLSWKLFEPPFTSLSTQCHAMHGRIGHSKQNIPRHAVTLHTYKHESHTHIHLARTSLTHLPRPYTHQSHTITKILHTSVLHTYQHPKYISLTYLHILT